MNKNIIILIALLLPFMVLISAETQKEQTSKNYVKVIYFHGENRCSTCLTIEQLTKDAVKELFENELKSNKVVMDVINFDEKANQHYIDDYKLFNQALIMVKYKNGKQVGFKDCPKIWELTGSRDNFFKYVKKEVNKYLKGL